MNLTTLAIILAIWSIAGLFFGMFFIVDKIARINYRIIPVLILLGPLTCFLVALTFFAGVLYRLLNLLSSCLIKWINKE
jgi:hypothetical protein